MARSSGVIQEWCVSHIHPAKGSNHLINDPRPDLVHPNVNCRADIAVQGIYFQWNNEAKNPAIKDWNVKEMRVCLQTMSGDFKKADLITD